MVLIGDQNAPPMILSQVCRAWRKIVINMCPEFWSRIYICVPLAKAGSRGHWDALLSLILTRSQDRDLDIVFRDNGAPMNNTLRHSLLSTLLRTSNRWCAATFNIPSCRFRLLDQARGNLSHLRQCVLHCMGIAPIHQHIEDMALLEGAPILQMLVIKKFHAHVQVRIPSSFGRMSHFEDDRSHDSGRLHRQYLHLLCAMPSLQVFRAFYCGLSTTTLLPANPPILCPNMHTFGACDSALLHSVILPRLSTIELSTSHQEWCQFTDPTVFQALCTLIIRSQCVLTHLRIANTVLLNDILLVISSTPSLIELRIEFDLWVLSCNNVLIRLFHRLTGRGLAYSVMHHSWPLLQSLTLTIWSSFVDCNVAFVGETMVAMIEDRIKGRHFWVANVESHTPRASFSHLTHGLIERLRSIRLGDEYNIRLVGRESYKQKKFFIFPPEEDSV